MGMLDTAHKSIHAAAKALGMSQASIDKLLEAEAEHVFEIEAGGKKHQAYRVQHSSSRGMYKGGIRFHEDVDLEEALKKFEEGLGLVKDLKSHLNQIENKVVDIKKQFKSNTFEVGVGAANDVELRRLLEEKFSVSETSFKSIHDDLKVKIKIDASSTPNDLLSFLTNQGQVNHFTEVIPSASDIFIQSVQNN